MKKIILFLIRRKLGLKKYQAFMFDNQKNFSIYWFTPNCLMKYDCQYGWFRKSTVSLNWLLDDDCKITVVQQDEQWLKEGEKYAKN